MRKMPRRLNDSDKDFIIENYTKMTDREIANVLNCSTRTIERFRSSSGLSKRASASKEIDRDFNISTGDQDEVYWERNLTNSNRGRRLREKVTSSEWPVVKDEWVAYHMQLEDLTHTEENTIEQIIILKLRMDRNQKEYKESAELRSQIMEEAQISDIKDLDLTDPDQASLYEKSYGASIKMNDLNKEYKELLDKATKLQETLNVTRKQREEGGRVGADTFFALCRVFENKNEREKAGRMAELLKISTEKNMTGLRGAVEYMDGEIAPQLLDDETIDKMDNDK